MIPYIHIDGKIKQEYHRYTLSYPYNNFINIYIYIYIYRERERETKKIKIIGKIKMEAEKYGFVEEW